MLLVSRLTVLGSKITFRMTASTPVSSCTESESETVPSIKLVATVHTTHAERSSPTSLGLSIIGLSSPNSQRKVGQAESLLTCGYCAVSQTVHPATSESTLPVTHR